MQVTMPFCSVLVVPLGQEVMLVVLWVVVVEGWVVVVVVGVVVAVGTIIDVERDNAPKSCW